MRSCSILLSVENPCAVHCIVYCCLQTESGSAAARASPSRGAARVEGFLRVYMNLLRPIKMSLATRPPSTYDLVCPASALDATGNGSANTGSGLFVYDDNDVLTSFYLPRGTTKILHIHRYFLVHGSTSGTQSTS